MNSGSKVDLFENSPCFAENFIVELAELSDEDVVANIDQHIKSITDFLIQNKNEIYGIHIIRIAFGKFLPHLPFEVVSETIVEISLEHLLQHITDVLAKIEDVTQENICYIECLISGIGACDFLINYVDNIKSEGNYVDVEKMQNVPGKILQILNSVVKYIKENKDVCNHDIEELKTQFIALLNETLEFSRKVSNSLKGFEWNKNDLTIYLLADVCHDICHLAQLLAHLPSGVKASLEAWKAFASFIQIRPNDLGKKLCLNIPIKCLSANIIDEIESLRNFPIESSTDEKVLAKIIRTVGFNLKIVTRICQLYRGYLREAHKHLINIILSIYRYRYSSEDILQINFPDKFLEQFEQQVICGIEELISNLLSDKLFAKEVERVFPNFDASKQTYSETASDLPPSVLQESILNESSCDANGSQVHLLMLCTSIIKQLLYSNKADDVNLWEPMIIDHIINIIAFCHVELSVPLKLLGVMHDGRPQEAISLYHYTMIYVCGFMSVITEDQYKNTENLLFSFLLSNNVWRSQFAMDILCFIGRYGKESLCEDHCFRLMLYLQYNVEDKTRRSTAVTLLSRLLRFLSPSNSEKLLSRWFADYKNHFLLAKVISQLTFDLSEEFQLQTDRFIVGCTNEKLDRLFTEISFSFMKELMTYLEALSLYCGSYAVKMDRLNVELQEALKSNIVMLFKRIPANFLECSIVSRICSLTIYAILHFINLLNPEDLFVIVATCCDFARESASADVSLAVCDLIAALRFVKFSDTKYGENTLRKLEEMLSILISSSNSFVHQSAMRVMVSFGKNTSHDEVFPNCIELCSAEEQETVTKYLQMIPRDLPVDTKVSNYLEYQRTILLKPRRYSTFIFIPIKNDKHCSNKEKSKENVHKSMFSDSLENSFKKRKIVETESKINISFQKLSSNLAEAKSIIDTSDKNSFTFEESLIIGQTLEELVNIWKTRFQ